MTTEIKITGQDLVLAFDVGLITREEARAFLGLPTSTEGDK
jgi:hypothetical protein